MAETVLPGIVATLWPNGSLGIESLKIVLLRILEYILLVLYNIQIVRYAPAGCGLNICRYSSPHVLVSILVASRQAPSTASYWRKSMTR